MTAPIVALDHVGVLGGAELSMLDVCVGLMPDVRVRLFGDGPFREALEARGVPVQVSTLGALGRVSKSSRMPGPAALASLWTLAGDVARDARGSTVLYANSQKAFVVGALARLRGGPPLVWHLRDLLGAPHFSRTNTWGVVTLANRAATRVICNSQATADAFIRHGGHASLVRVVHNGIDAGAFDRVSAEQISTYRAEHAGRAGQVLAVFGRIASWKGQHVAIDALAQLPSDTRLWIVGAPLFGEEPYADSLRTRAESLGVSDRVWFAGFRDDVPGLMRAADVVVHASELPEPFGRVVVEGMLAGRPVIATRGGGVEEIVADGVTGCLVAAGDVRQLVDVARRLRNEPLLAARLAEAGQAHARAEFGVEAMVHGVRRVLDEVMRA